MAMAAAQQRREGPAASPTWRARSLSLSTLDVLTALEARAVQQDETSLHKLVEDLLTQDRIVEGLMLALSQTPR